jgi:hypothetical protein
MYPVRKSGYILPESGAKNHPQQESCFSANHNRTNLRMQRQDIMKKSCHTKKDPSLQSGLLASSQLRTNCRDFA